MDEQTDFPASGARREHADRAREVLLDASLDSIVDLVAWKEGDEYHAASSQGSVHFTRRAGTTESFEEREVNGAHPLPRRETDAFPNRAIEEAEKYPTREQNSFPYAYEHLAQLLDAAAAPDLVVLHSAAHNWQDQGGHRGEHGSLGIVQARAPFILSGAGIADAGVLNASARLVDVAPTIAALMRAPVRPDGTLIARQAGTVRSEVLDPDVMPKLILGILWDGTNANVLYDMAVRGEAPHIAHLMASGTSFGGGAMASLPTITLANHTTVMTGQHPGCHGILGNAWYDRRKGKQIVTNSPETWPWSMDALEPGVESLHHVASRSIGGFTVAINEPCDIGAGFSTFDVFRAGEFPEVPEHATGLPHTTERFVRPSKDYDWSSVVDHLAMEQVIGVLNGQYQDRTFDDTPAYMWANFTLTDSAMHEGGPYSEVAAAAIRDSDARLGEILDTLDHKGLIDSTAIYLLADHGMEETNPEVTGNWDEHLREAGLQFRDEGYGFIYLDVE